MQQLAGAVLANPISPSTLLSGSAALLVLAVVLFAECGLLIGFFLPGDTLLFAAGVSLSVGTIHTPLIWFLVVAPLAAIAGNLLGYVIGYRVGPRVFDRPDSRLFRPEYVQRSHAFFERFGAATIVIGRFVPVVRTVATVLAGVGRMRLSLYVAYTVVGAVLWADGVIVVGHLLGRVSVVRDHVGWIDPIVVAVVVVGLVPTAVHLLRSRRGRRASSPDHRVPVDQG